MVESHYGKRYRAGYVLVKTVPGSQLEYNVGRSSGSEVDDRHHQDPTTELAAAGSAAFMERA